LDKAYPVLSWFIENGNRKYLHVRESNPIEPLCEALLLTTELAASVMMKVTANSKQLERIDNSADTDEAMLGITNRGQALNFIGGWLEQCEAEIILCDPYFGATERDLDFFKLVLANCPRNELIVITSKKLLMEQKILTDELFLEKWKDVSDQDPPVTKFIGTSIDGGVKSVIHDRWLISGDRGLRFGTSFNGIGTGRLSEISRLNDSEVIITLNELKKFVNNERMIAGTKVSYLTFTI
jgi:hypothetical protein